MKKTLFLLLAAVSLMLTACDGNKTDNKETSSKRNTNSVARAVLDDALSRVKDSEATGEDLLPRLDVNYVADNGTWQFTKSSEKEDEIVAVFTPNGDGKVKRYTLSARGNSAYDLYPEGRAVTAGMILRVKDGGAAIDEETRSNTTTYKCE